MTTGKVTKLVTSYGSVWGRITPDGQVRSIFFNSSTLEDHGDFTDMTLDREVEFEEESDRANGTHVIRVRVRQPSETSSASGLTTESSKSLLV